MTAMDAEPGLEWIDLFCPADSLQAILTDTWAARWDGRTFITDNHVLWDADALRSQITDPLPAMADGQVCHDPADPTIRAVYDNTDFAEKVGVLWRDRVEAAVPAAGNASRWAAGRLTFSDFRTNVGTIATTGDRATAVFVDARRTALIERLGCDAYLFGTDRWIHLTATGTTRTIGYMQVAQHTPTGSDPVLAALAADSSEGRH